MVKPEERNEGAVVALVDDYYQHLREKDKGLPEFLPGLDIAAGLKRIEGNTWLYRQLLIDFARRYSMVTEKIAEHIKKDDFPEAERIVHTLKGVAGNIAAGEMRKTAAELEAAIANRNSSAYEPLLHRLEQHVRILLEGIKKSGLLKTENVPVDAKPLATAQVAVVLTKMHKLLAENDPDAEKFLEYMREILQGPLFAKEMAELETHLGNYDFELALIPLRKIAGCLNIIVEE
ncbi:Hpt domain-containing protein [Azotosporobacter soli]|uniref:Hpt domain-containing protein n=1 Tax=Azotosporobacter soli TaxID=3055040 RepID=UPI0031FF18C8